MSRTLYISDLDGTLLNPDAVLSPFTKQALCRLTEQGISLSIATARTAATVKRLLAGVPLNTPVILMNGVATYDLTGERYTKAFYLEDEARKILLDTVHRHNLAGFCYGVKDNTLITCYENLNSPGAVRFMESRQKQYGKVFTRVEDFCGSVGSEMLYYSISDYEEKLAPVAAELRRLPGVRVEFYRDIYEKDCFFLEVSSAATSKKTAAEALRRQYGFDRLVGFGDNRNDLALAEACDEFYAVENAVEAVKAVSSAVIGSNGEDGVARWLLENAHV